jgi:signal transduction histidine kinase
VLQLLNRREGAFTESDRVVLELLAAPAASAIENAALHEEAKLAFVARTTGRISHDIANMIQPSVGGAATLCGDLDAMFDRLDALRAEFPGTVSWPEVDAAAATVRAFYPELCRLTQDGAEDVQERARQIVEAVRGEIASPEFEPCRAADLAERVFRALGPPARGAGIALELAAPDDLPPVALDRRSLYNALYNLVDNALDATPAGGRVTVRLRVEPTAGPDGDQLVIEVADTGCGMPAAVAARLFTDQVVTTKHDGTGLGTKVVRSVVERHGGTVSVASVEGQGSTFTLRLPLQQPAAAAG